MPELRRDPVTGEEGGLDKIGFEKGASIYMNVTPPEMAGRCLLREMDLCGEAPVAEASRADPPPEAS